MHSEILSIDGMATVKMAADKMRQEQVSELLVERRHEDDAWGIITIMDIVEGVLVPGQDADDVSVYEIMTKPVITVPAVMDIRYATRLIHRMKIHRAPVEHMGEIVGMVTLDSLILEHELL
jgi:signal-transduction protein with cAMP-binding, CBS, and nucleotidyltransferase domain